jgi:hypothetical protein
MGGGGKGARTGLSEGGAAAEGDGGEGKDGHGAQHDRRTVPHETAGDQGVDQQVAQAAGARHQGRHHACTRAPKCPAAAIQHCARALVMWEMDDHPPMSHTACTSP